jgi:hypothetical protein
VRGSGWAGLHGWARKEGRGLLSKEEIFSFYFLKNSNKMLFREF